MKKICLFFIILLFSTITVYAHPGRTDSKGGHTDSSTGEYHYHHGYSAHQHEDGKCPYDFDDKTNHSSSSSSKTVSNGSEKTSTTETETNSKETTGLVALLAGSAGINVYQFFKKKK